MGVVYFRSVMQNSILWRFLYTVERCLLHADRQLSVICHLQCDNQWQKSYISCTERQSVSTRDAEARAEAEGEGGRGRGRVRMRERVRESEGERDEREREGEGDLTHEPLV